MSKAEELYQALLKRCHELGILHSLANLAGWDEQVFMPKQAGEFRAEQATYLAAEIHKKFTDPAMGDLLKQLADSELASDPYSDAGVNIRKLKRKYEKQAKLPQSLVEELARISVLGQQAWIEARKNNDFPAFLPYLEKIVALKREEAAAVGFAEVPYDALLDDYEPEELTSNVTRVLEGLRADLVPFVAAIAESDKKPNSSLLQQPILPKLQEKFGRKAAASIGFDFDRGRLDVSTHPFCSGMAPNDCRMTTRYDENLFNESFSGILHESGHGLYEQGLPIEHFGTPLGDTVSLGIHESQSRMWENQVGRSRSFWQYWLPEAQSAFAPALNGVSLDDFYFAMNEIKPSFIRVEADEATYNLHILVRFELEQAFLNQELEAADVRDAWNEKYQQYLGITPPNDTLGCLQDIHWSGGAIGYFSTYALGNLYAAQFFEKACQDLGDVDSQFSSGDYQPLLTWLRENIHSHGQRYTAAELVERVTGKPLSHVPFMNYLRAKLGPLYGLTK